MDQANAPIQLVVADDHHVVRRALRLWLESENDVEVIAEAGDVPTAIRHVKRHLPHVLLLDLRMPNGSSIEAIRRLREEVPETQIVVATMEESPLFARQALDAGAIGYVLKDNADTELQTAVRSAARGETYVSPCIAARLDGMRRAAQDDGLSPRETDVLRLIALGLDQRRDVRAASSLTAHGRVASPADPSQARTQEALRARPVRPRTPSDR